MFALLLLGACFASLPEFEAGAFYRFSMGGAEGFVIEMEFSEAPRTTSFSILVPGSMLDSFTADGVCENIILDLQPLDNGKFRFNMPFGSDPCLKVIQSHVLMFGFYELIGDEVPIIYDPELDSFEIDFVVNATLKRCNKTDPIPDDSDDEEDDGEGGENDHFKGLLVLNEMLQKFLSKSR